MRFLVNYNENEPFCAGVEGYGFCAICIGRISPAFQGHFALAITGGNEQGDKYYNWCQQIIQVDDIININIINDKDYQIKPVEANMSGISLPTIERAMANSIEVYINNKLICTPGVSKQDNLSIELIKHYNEWGALSDSKKQSIEKDGIDKEKYEKESIFINVIGGEEGRESLNWNWYSGELNINDTIKVVVKKNEVYESPIKIV
jgi:hypothetical protein